MPGFSELQHRVRGRMARAIAPRSPQRTAAEQAYYRQQPSCQIPDLWFLYSRFLGERPEGCFVEVGAHDGVFVSNTWGLAEAGWRGLMIEPVPDLAQLCRANHHRHSQVVVCECAIGSGDSDAVTLQFAGAFTSANPEVLKEYASVEWAAPSVTSREFTVPCRTLDVVLGDYQVPIGFDVLVVDVEGFEGEVFRGFSLGAWQPRMLIVELADTHPDLQSTAAVDAELGTRILDAGYRIAFKDRVNTVFVHMDVWNSTF